VSRAVIILQARMGSMRLPGKVLAPIGARSLLGHCIARLRIGSAAPVMLATTTTPLDDVLVAAAAPYGIPVFRGPEDDVLSRYVLAARSMGARFVVRATADNPAIDIDGPERLLRELRATGADYVVEGDLPYGACVEAMTTEALNRAALAAADPYDREHVTTFIRRDPRFHSLTTSAPAGVRRPELRVTVDTAEDLSFMRALAARMNNWAAEPELTHIIRTIDALAVEAKVA
jgi:spore coat polysaccharide biosynthesis protein SpsF (cytidylyltransferase family)